MDDLFVITNAALAAGCVCVVSSVAAVEIYRGQREVFILYSCMVYVL